MLPNRRKFLETSLWGSSLLTLGGTAPSFLLRSAPGAEPRRKDDASTLLVVVQLSGGNDGLNCVVPYADDDYARARSTLRLTQRDVLRLDDYLGLHPALQDCKRLFDEGRFAVVQGVGYPESSRDHVAAERHWQSALPTGPEPQTGWVGRCADTADRAGTSGVISVALVTPAGRPFAVNSGHAIVPHIRTPEDAARLGGPGDDALAASLAQIAAEPRPDASSLLEFVRANASQVASARDRLRSPGASSPAIYPQTRFAQRLKTIADLIRADLGFRIFYTELGGDGFGGFDNHANQKENHAALLTQFSGGTGAFLDDLRRDGLEQRVLLMTLSEFGRTVAENGRRGTDHGAAAPVFLAGGRIKPGLTGAHPSLKDLDKQALRFHTDFRQVYATAVDRWLGWDARAILGADFEPLNILV